MLVLFAAVLGLVVGSFLNVMIGRLRSGEKGWRARSRCPRCHAVLRPSELVPLVSFFALRGRCRSCKQPISWQYPLVELSTALLFATSFAFKASFPGMQDAPAYPDLSGIIWILRDWFFFSVLTIIFIIDLRDMVVFDAVTLPAAIIAFVVNLALGHDLFNLLLAAAIGAGFFLLQYAASRGRWIGGGDIRIGLLMGCMLGSPLILLALLAAYVAGAIVALALLAFGKARWSGRMAFGTFLSAATVFVLLFGEPVSAWYAAILGLS